MNPWSKLGYDTPFTPRPDNVAESYRLSMAFVLLQNQPDICKKALIPEEDVV